MRKLFSLFIRVFALMVILISFGYSSDGACHGRFLNPITEINWNLILPIKVAGATVAGGGSNESPLAVTSPMCVCPGRLMGTPTPGVMATFHEPLYIQEIARVAGCFSSIGGVNVLSGYNMQNMSLDLDASQGDIARWQVHWYQYPVFKLLKIFQDFACVQTGGDYALSYVTEVDPTWQNDEWGAVFNPEAILFANPIAQAACILDAISSTAYIPLDPLVWCAGSWGGVYPFTGNANANSDRLQSAYLVGAKMIAKLSRTGMLWDTVGQWAMCSAMPSAFWIKSQFTLDPVYPVVKEGLGVPIGSAPIAYLNAPPQSYPMVENVTNVVFQEQQCCMHI